MAVRVEVQCGSDAESVRHAREFVAATLAAWHLEDLSDVAVLLTSEVATNAVIHARTAFRLTLQLQPPDLLVEVADGSPAEPSPRNTVPVVDEHGRGLQMVDALAASWGWRAADAGKIVWFLVRNVAA